MNITCCKNCEIRKFNCHSECEEYNRQKELNELLRERMAKNVEAMKLTYTHENNKNRRLRKGVY